MQRLQTPTYELLPSLQAVAEGLEARSPSLLRMEEDFEALFRFMTPGESGCIRTRLVQMRRSWQELMEKTEQLTGQLNQSASYRQRCSDNLEQVFFAICRNDWLFFWCFFWHHKCVFISLGQENDAWSQRETQRFCCALLVVIADVHKPTKPHGKKKKRHFIDPAIDWQPVQRVPLAHPRPSWVYFVLPSRKSASQWSSWNPDWWLCVPLWGGWEKAARWSKRCLTSTSCKESYWKRPETNNQHMRAF